MMTIDKVDLLRLAPYGGKDWKSFEIFCFMLVRREYPKADITPVNGSGGDGGVEFYITNDGGREIGWQCKFFDKLGESQKSQITKSYKSVENNHGSKLDEWVLCTPIDFTPAQNKWFDSFKADKKIKITHWGESVILSVISKFPDVGNFFFNTGWFNTDWFEKQARLVLHSEVIRTKYIPEAHDVTYAQRTALLSFQNNRIHKKICQVHESLLTQNALTYIEQNIDNYCNKIKDKGKLTNRIVESAKRIPTLCIQISGCVEDIVKALSEGNWREVLSDKKKFLKLSDEFTSEATQLQKVPIKEEETFYFHLSQIGDYIASICLLLERATISDLHIIGKASKGKSHLAIDIFCKETGNKGQGKDSSIEIREDFRRPSLLILASQLNPASGNLERMILEKLGIPETQTFDDFLSALDIAGSLNKCKTLLIIDGLNEAYGIGNVWKRDLENLILKVSHFPNILLILTYRKSYLAYLGLEDYFNNPTNSVKQIEVDGLNYWNIEDVIDKYLKHYNISLAEDIPEWLNEYFAENPLMISLFCDAHKDEQNLRVNEIELIDIFESFLKKCSDRFLEATGKDRRYEKYSFFNRLSTIANHLWESGKRTILLSDLSELMTTDEIRVLDSEELLVLRDISEDKEEFSFTYDLLAGYIIARSLLKNVNDIECLKNLVNSAEIRDKLIIKGEKNHALRDVILDNLLKLAVNRFGFFYDDKFKIPRSYLLPALFNSRAEVFRNNYDTQIVERIRQFLLESLNENRRALYNIPMYNLLDERHPLSLAKIDKAVMQLPTYLRDLSWTEALRVNSRLWDAIDNSEVPPVSALATTITGLRKNLIYRFSNLALSKPSEFVEILCSTFGADDIKITDAYIQEGMISAAYGALLTLQDVVREGDSLTSLVAAAIIDGIESRRLMYRHYLIRNYSHLILKLAARKGLIEYPESLVSRMYADDKIAKEEVEKWRYAASEDYPMMHDFSNYTIGYMIPNGSAYDNPPLKCKTRGFIFDRIKEIGWTEERFEEVDREISNEAFRQMDEHGKIERYGKKYSWSGYYFAASMLEDANLLDTTYHDWRVPEVAFDITFPQYGENVNLDTPDLLAAEDSNGNIIKNDDANSISNEEWIKLPFYNHWCEGICEREIDGKTYVSLYGQYSQRDEELRRKVLVFMTALIVDKEDADRFEHLQNISKNDYSYREPPHCTNPLGAGFDCWQQATKSNERKVELETENTIEYEEEATFFDIIKAGSDGITVELNEGDKIKKTRPVLETFKVLYPIVEYHNEKDPESSVHYYLDYSLKEDLQLSHNPNNSLNLIDKDGKEGLKVYQYAPEKFEGTNTFVYLDKEKMQSWLKAKGKRLLILAWGERETWQPKVDDDPHPLHDFRYFSIPVYSL